jgi:hypothetical protein
VLGRIVEQVSGRPYEAYVQAEVLAPAGIGRMRIGRSTLEGRAEGEVRYYDHPWGKLVRSVFFTGIEYVPEPYGGFHLEAIQPPWEDASGYYAMGWQVERAGDDTYWSHAGGLVGTRTWLFRTHDGFVGAVLFNGSANAGGLEPALLAALERTTRRVRKCPRTLSRAKPVSKGARAGQSNPGSHPLIRCRCAPATSRSTPLVGRMLLPGLCISRALSSFTFDIPPKRSIIAPTVARKRCEEGHTCTR